MFDSLEKNADELAPQAVAAFPLDERFAYHVAKRGLDLFAALLCLPVVGLFTLALMAVNPFFNAGPVFFLQPRMGRDLKVFRVVKFRSMSVRCEEERGAFMPVESARITPLGRFLRRARIDELPQVWNILRGEMSLVGPRPDFVNHARVYLDTIPGYRERHAVRPGVTGLAQIEVGYVDCRKGVTQKVAADLRYIRTASLMLDLSILLRTIRTVIGLKGS